MVFSFKVRAILAGRTTVASLRILLRIAGIFDVKFGCVPCLDGARSGSRLFLIRLIC